MRALAIDSNACHHTTSVLLENVHSLLEEVYSDVLWETDQNRLVSPVLTNTSTSQSSRTTEHDFLNMTQTPIDILTLKVKAQEASTLDIELQAAIEFWKQETKSFSGKRAPISHIIPNGHLWKHVIEVTLYRQKYNLFYIIFCDFCKFHEIWQKN